MIQRVRDLSPTHRRLVRRVLIGIALLPVYGVALLGVVVMTAAGTGDDHAETLERSSTDRNPELATGATTTTTSAPRPMVTSPTVPAPTTAPPTTAPVETTVPEVPTTVATPAPPASGFVLQVRIVYAERACNGDTVSPGCAARPGVITLADSRGTGPSSFTAVTDSGANAKQFDVTIPVPAETTTWSISADLAYVGPCGAADVVGPDRYQLVVAPDAKVKLIGIGAAGTLRRPQPDDQRWIATIDPYGFGPPEPGC